MGEGPSRWADGWACGGGCSLQSKVYDAMQKPGKDLQARTVIFLWRCLGAPQRCSTCVDVYGVFLGSVCGSRPIPVFGTEYM